MNKIARFVIWICSKFTRSEIEQIIKGLTEVLNNRNPEVKPKDDFREKHPHYRDFSVDPMPPLKNPPKKTLSLNWKDRLIQYENQHGQALKPVQVKNPNQIVPLHSTCLNCGAPSKYLYFNNGKKRTQLKCKICSASSPLNRRYRTAPKYYCPYCQHPLYRWKEQPDCTFYKCGQDSCRFYLANKKKLNFAERLLFSFRPSQFKLRYQFREYHFTPAQLRHSAPDKNLVNLSHIRQTLSTLVLALTFHVSFALSARKTALILRSVFGIPLSYQTVLNYAQSAAYYCHLFNLAYKGTPDNISAGDEFYIKIAGKQAYTFLFISGHKIMAYQVADSRDTLPAVISIQETIRTARPDQALTIVSDGNPSYAAGILFINQTRENPLVHKKVMGLQNLDAESEEYRTFKQLIERLGRTYKHHIRPANGFTAKHGAVTLTTLFVTHYNFLRPHMALDYAVPIEIKELQDIPRLQDKWAKIIQMGYELDQAA